MEGYTPVCVAVIIPADSRTRCASSAAGSSENSELDDMDPDPDDTLSLRVKEPFSEDERDDGL